MRAQPMGRYIYCGAILRYLKDVRVGWEVHGKDEVIENVERFVALLGEFELRVTLRAAEELVGLLERFRGTPRGYSLSAEDADELRGLIAALEVTLSAESAEKRVYVLSSKRFDTGRLLGDIRSLMGAGVFEALPSLAQYDFAQAGRCMAFDLATATAFHLLRGTEATLRNLYCSVVRAKRVTPLLWGAMVRHLRQCGEDTPAPLLNNLDNIREFYRNPTHHPDKTYDIEEAQDLFALCAEVVSRMVRSSSWEVVPELEGTTYEARELPAG